MSAAFPAVVQHANRCRREKPEDLFRERNDDVFRAAVCKDKILSNLCISSAETAYAQCQAIDKNIKIGLTPMIGRGGDKGAEVFTLTDGKTLEKWAAEKPWVTSLSFWCANRDTGKPGKRNPGTTASGVEQQPWEYSKAFQPFTEK